MDKKGKTIITVETSVNAPAGKVWEYFTTPEHITKWYHAEDDWYVPYADNDLHINRKFKTTMASKDGSMSFDFEGIYTNIRKNKLIEYKILDGRKVKISFSNQGKATKIIESFETENENPVELQKTGWQAILNNFKSYTETANA